MEQIYQDILSDQDRLTLERWIGLVAKHTDYTKSMDLYLHLSRSARDALDGPDDGFSWHIGELWMLAASVSPATLQYLCAVELWDGSYEEGPTTWRFRKKTGNWSFEDLERIRIADEVRTAEARRARYKRSTVSAGNLEAHLARKLKTDYTARFEMAHRMGAKITGHPQRADKIKCPQCGRHTVYFYIEPGARNVAKCKHETSCGWYGNLLQLARSA